MVSNKYKMMSKIMKNNYMLMKLNRCNKLKYWLSICAILIFVGVKAAEKPNVLFIMTDQQTYTMMSCMGTEGLHTPNLDKLAEKGYRFNNTYVTNPVCMPSRFSLLTGHYSSDIGVKQNVVSFDPQKLNNILKRDAMGVVFRNAGYETLYSGKLHLYGTSDVSEYGFDFDGEDPYEGPTLFAEKTFAEMAKTKPEKPFLMFLSYLNPHDICYKAGMDSRYPYKLAPDRAAETIRLLEVKGKLSEAEYQNQIPAEPINRARILGEEKEVVAGADTGREWDEDEWQLYYWMYYRLNESVDHLIGRVLTALENSGLDDNTIVVFTSDHGEMNGAHELILKNVMFEEAQRVPFIFAGKGIQHKIDNKAMVCNGLDLIPTLCDLTGVEVPQSLTGISLKPYLTGKGKVAKRKYIITESYNSFQITDGRYKYTVYELPDHPEILVDLKKNPGETINYSDDSSYAKIKIQLKNELMQNLKERELLPLLSDRTLVKVNAENKALMKSRREKALQ
jgi:choline-sulfatase